MFNLLYIIPDQDFLSLQSENIYDNTTLYLPTSYVINEKMMLIFSKMAQ